MDILPIGTRVDNKKQLQGKKEIGNTKKERKKEKKYIGAELTRKVDTIIIVTRDMDDGDKVREYIKEIHADLLNTFTALKIKLKLVKYQSALSDNKRLKKELDGEVMSIVQEIRDSMIGSSLLLDEPVLETIQADDYRRDLVNIGDYIQTYDNSLGKLEPINRAIEYLRDDIKDTEKKLRQSTAYIAELESVGEYRGAIKWLYEYIDAFATQYNDALKEDEISVEEDDTTRVDNDDGVLSELQRRCIDLMSVKAREFSDAVTQDDYGDLDARVKYVRDREVVSHQCIIKLLEGIIESGEDTIKSSFVTKTTMSGGGRLNLKMRKKTERLLFDGLFDDQPDEERPIYGAINLIGDPEGVSSCQGYNISYVVLKEPVKLRMTITEKDSITGDDVPLDIGTFLHMNHIVDTLDSDALNMYVSGHKFSPGDNDELQSDSYVEVQIHGKVRLSYDVKRFMIDPKYASNERVIWLVDEFRRRFPCDLVFQVIGGEEW